MLWNFFVLLYLELALEMCVCFNLNYYNEHYGADDFNRASYALTWILGLGYVLFVVLAVWFLKAPGRDERLLLPKNLRRYGALYEEFRLSDDALNYVILWLARRSAFAWLATYDWEEPVLLVCLFYVSTMVSAVYLVHVRPYFAGGQNIREGSNAYFELVMIFLLSAFIGEAQDPPTRYSTGWLICGVLALYIACHLCVMVTYNFRALRRDARRWRATRCCLKAHEKRLQAISSNTQDYLAHRKLISERGLTPIEAAAVLTQGNERKKARIARKELYRKLKAEKDLSIYVIERDGNCLFSAVSHQIFATTARHREVRTLAASHILSKPQYFRSFVDD